VGDVFVSGATWGKVRALLDDTGAKTDAALPSQPVEVLGFLVPPAAGDDFVVLEAESVARSIAEMRERKRREAATAIHKPMLTLENFMAVQKSEGKLRELPLILKVDVQGSLEAIQTSLQKIATDEVKVRILYSGVGGITESDINLAKASGALVIGFNVRANAQAREFSQRDAVEIRYYSIIYQLLDEVKAALSGLLSPVIKENFLGNAAIRQVFNITKVGRIAGCYVTNGIVKRGGRVRLLRDDVVIHEGLLKTLKRLKDEVREVREGYECGMAFENYQDIREGDVIECFELETIRRSL
jgi:translation initiation factor IF-2